MAKTDFIDKVATALVCGAIWVAAWYFNMYVTAFSNFAPGINLIYLPAGVRLLLVLACGAWGASGIALFTPLLFISSFGEGDALEIALNSITAGYVPLAAVRICCTMMGVGGSLAELKPVHLPLIALAVAAATPLAFNLQFLAFGRAASQQFWRDYAAMALGDFLGCLLVIAAARLLIGVYRLAAR